MAAEDNWKKIKEKREREDEVDSGIKEITAPRIGAMKLQESKLLVLIQKAESLIEKVNSLYSQYFSGVEKLPPYEARHQLDLVWTEIDRYVKITPMERYRFQAFQTHARTYMEKWDLQLKRYNAAPRKSKS